MGTAFKLKNHTLYNKDKDKRVKDKITFCVWFAETLAKQLSILYSVRACHNYILPHNITMAAEIVDLDSMVSDVLMDIDKEVSPDKIFQDVAGGWKCLALLMNSVELEHEKIHKLLLQHYFGRYLEYVAELRFKPDPHRADVAKRELAIALEWVTYRGKENGKVRLFDNGHEKEQTQFLEYVKQIFLSVDSSTPMPFVSSHGTE